MGAMSMRTFELKLISFTLVVVAVLGGITSAHANIMERINAASVADGVATSDLMRVNQRLSINSWTWEIRNGRGRVTAQVVNYTKARSGSLRLQLLLCTRHFGQGGVCHPVMTSANLSPIKGGYSRTDKFTANVDLNRIEPRPFYVQLVLSEYTGRNYAVQAGSTSTTSLDLSRGGAASPGQAAGAASGVANAPAGQPAAPGAAAPGAAAPWAGSNGTGRGATVPADYIAPAAVAVDTSPSDADAAVTKSEDESVYEESDTSSNEEQEEAPDTEESENSSAAAAEESDATEDESVSASDSHEESSANESEATEADATDATSEQDATEVESDASADESGEESTTEADASVEATDESDAVEQDAGDDSGQESGHEEEDRSEDSSSGSDSGEHDSGDAGEEE
jgi:hypothetical protein